MSNETYSPDDIAKTQARQNEIVRADHVSMVFNVANERISSLKEYFIKIIRHELMFKEFTAVDDVSFTIERGDVFGLVGTNGSGKSTMLKIIAGVLEPTKGLCAVNGAIAPLIELGAGFDMELSARENIYLNGALLGYSKAFIDEHFDSIVEFAEVENFLEMPMKNYSSGMIARIAFAIATETIPDLLIVDEVLSVGDFMFQKKCERRITSLIEEHGVTVIIVSHDNGLIERLCNKALWIEKGHTKAYGDAKDVCDLYSVLGGHSGTAQSAKRVEEIFNSNIPIKPDTIRSISAEDRYGATIRLLEEAEGLEHAAYAVIAPGESPQTCFIANSVAGLLEAPVLLVRNDSIPDMTANALKRINAETIVLLGLEGQYDVDMASLVSDVVNADVSVISGTTYSKLALAAYAYGQESGRGWSDTFLITHKDCTSDHISFSPFTYREKVPVFFNSEPGVISEKTCALIGSDACSSLLVCGGFVSFPESSLSGISDKVNIERFCAEEGYKSGTMISGWIMRQNCGFALEDVLVSSVWFPENAFAAGFYCSRKGSIILMEDPQNLDSVVTTFDYLASNREMVGRLVFLGNSALYSDIDKSILAKSLCME